MFVNKQRLSQFRGLYCCLLPKLEVAGTKTRLLISGKESIWTRETVDKHLHHRARQWLHNSEQLCAEAGSPYTHELAKFIIFNFRGKKIMHDGLLAFIKSHGTVRNEETIVQLHRARKRARLGNVNGRCAKSHQSLAWDCLKSGAALSNGFLTPTKITSKRKMCYTLDYDKIE